MAVRLSADKFMSQYSENGELMMGTSKKAPVPHKGAAALATASLTTLTLVTAMNSLPHTVPLDCTAQG